MKAAEKIYFTDDDYEVLGAVLDKSPDSSAVQFLEGELARAEVVPAGKIPGNVVTLNSRVRILDETTAQERELTIVPPEDPGREDGRVSVLSPLGAAVIGLSEGQAMAWAMPSGGNRRFRVVKVLYQPEAERRGVDVVEQASMESFPASDAPGWRL